jgi:hypothetical protein
MSSDNLAIFQMTTCSMNNEEKTGKVLAITTYGDGRKTVCFQVDSIGQGQWIPVTALLDFVDEPVSLTQTEIEAEVEEDINALEDFVNNLEKSITNNIKDPIITVTALVVTDTQKTIHSCLSLPVVAVGEVVKFVTNSLALVTTVVKNIIETIVNYWNIHWKQRLVGLLTIGKVKSDLNQTQKIVQKIKDTYPDYSRSQIAQQLINEKVIWSTAIGLVGEIPHAKNVLKLVKVDLNHTTPLIIKMIYEIAYVYEQNEELNPDDIFAILSLALGVSHLTMLKLDVLLGNSPEFLVHPIANALLFLVVGYATLLYYEAKFKHQEALASEKIYKELTTEVGYYLKEASSETLEIEKSIEKGIHLKAKLPAAT